MPINYYTYLNTPQGAPASVLRAAAKMVQKQILAELNKASVLSESVPREDSIQAALLNYGIEAVLFNLEENVLATDELKRKYDAELSSATTEGAEFNVLNKAKQFLSSQEKTRSLGMQLVKKADSLKSDITLKAQEISALNTELEALKMKLAKANETNAELQSKQTYYAEQESKLAAITRDAKEYRKQLKSARVKLSETAAERRKFALFAEAPQPKAALQLKLGERYTGDMFPMIEKVYKHIRLPSLDIYSNVLEYGFSDIIFEFKNNEQRDLFLHRFNALRKMRVASLLNAETRSIAADIVLQEVKEKSLLVEFIPNSFLHLLQQSNDRSKEHLKHQGKYILAVLREIFDLENVPCHFMKESPENSTINRVLGCVIDPDDVDESAKEKLGIEDVITLLSLHKNSDNENVKRYIESIEDKYIEKLPETTPTPSFN